MIRLIFICFVLFFYSCKKTEQIGDKSFAYSNANDSFTNIECWKDGEYHEYKLTQYIAFADDSTETIESLPYYYMDSIKMNADNNTVIYRRKDKDPIFNIESYDHTIFEDGGQTWQFRVIF